MLIITISNVSIGYHEVMTFTTETGLNCNLTEVVIQIVEINLYALFHNVLTLWGQ